MRALSRLRQTFAAFQSPHPIPATATWANGYGGLISERSYMRDVGDGGNSSLVVPGIDFIANGFIEAPVRVQQRRSGTLEVVNEHPMVELIADPNPFYSGALMWMATVAEWIIDGNAYWLIVQSGAGRPAALIWIPSWFIEPKSDNPRELVTHYDYRPAGVNIRLELDEVVHFRWGLDRTNPRKGSSRLKTVLREIYSDEEAARWLAALLRNMGTPGLVISPKGDGAQFSPAKAIETKLDIIQKTTGDRRGEPLVMLAPTDTELYGFSPEQMDLSSLRAIPESRVPAVLGLPAAVLGFLAGMEQTKVGATMAEIRELGYESGIIPKMSLFGADLRSQLLKHYHDDVKPYRVDFDLSGVRVLQEDENKRVERELKIMHGGAQSREECRSRIGRDPDMPIGDTLTMPINIVPMPVDMAQQRPPAGAPAGGTSTAFARAQSTGQLAYVRRLERESAVVADAWATELSTALGGLGTRAQASYERLGVSLRLTPDPTDEPTVAAILADLDLEGWRETELGPIWQRQYLRMAAFAYESLGESMGLDIAIGLPDEVAREVVAQGGTHLGLVDLSTQTRAALFEALAKARAEQLGPIQAARLIRQYVPAGRFTKLEAERAGAGVRYRAELIARTETKYAQNIATAAAGDAAGFDRYLAFDNRTGFGDDDCVARDGQEFSHAEMLTEIADEHPNGTLSFAPVPGSQRRRATRNGRHAVNV